jgi:periplasmic divalent cation tolerance protein
MFTSMDDTSYVIVTTTAGSEELAMKLADLITSARLAACVQFWPIRSVYWWQGKMEAGTEFILQCKTKADLAPELQDFIRTHHPYEIPEIIVTPIIGGHPPYLNWIHQETSKRS